MCILRPENERWGFQGSGRQVIKRGRERENRFLVSLIVPMMADGHKSVQRRFFDKVADEAFRKPKFWERLYGLPQMLLFRGLRRVLKVISLFSLLN
jgi:hypothetical protein